MELPMKNNIHLSNEAQADLDEIKDYITVDLENPVAALATVTRIIKAIRILADHAFIGATLSSIVDTETDYRFLVSGNYLVFYRIHDKDVYVDRVLYGRRDFLRVLFGELSEETTE